MKIKSVPKTAVPPSVRTEIAKSLKRPNYTPKIPSIYSPKRISEFYAQCIADETAKKLNRKLR